MNKTAWIIKEAKPIPLRAVKVTQKPTLPLMKLANSQQVLRDYVAKNPATIMKVIAHKLGWTQSKAEFVKSTMKGEFYERGLILKSEVNVKKVAD